MVNESQKVGERRTSKRKVVTGSQVGSDMARDFFLERQAEEIEDQDDASSGDDAKAGDYNDNEESGLKRGHIKFFDAFS